MIAQLFLGISNVLQPWNFLFVFVGVVSGMIIGALPGLTASMGIALLIPFTFTMSPIPAICMVTSLYCGATYGASISAILVNAPGMPSSAATTFDGYPLARKGMAGKALGMACISSAIGGLFSVIVLVLMAPVLANVAINFGPPEYFALAIFGLSMISNLGGRSVVKNMIGACIGVFLSCVGMDEISGFTRYDFGITSLMDGIKFIPAMIGLFAASEVIRQAETGIRRIAVDRKIAGMLPSWKEIKEVKATLVRSSLIGTFIGILPAEGGAIASLIAYNEAKRFSKHPEKFGTGILEGVTASETANNAATGGAMVPTMALGIPGSAATAVILGAFMVQGMHPGPMLFVRNPAVIYSIFVGMFFSNLIFLIIGLLGAKAFSQIIRVPNYVMNPIILVLCIVGSYSLQTNMADVWIMIACGIIGYKIRKHGFAVAPIVLGLVLGGLIEDSLRRSLIVFENNPLVFFTRPYSALFLILTGLGLLSPVIRDLVMKRVSKRGTQNLKPRG